MQATFLDEVRSIIEQEFPGADISGITEVNHRVLGSIVWRDFMGKNVNERQQMITKKVLNKLGSKGLNVGIILPLAPGETF